MPGRIFVELITIGSITIYTAAADPNGSLSATLGSIATRTDSAAVYVNTDGATAWTQLGGGSAAAGVPVNLQRGTIGGTNDSFVGLQADGIFRVYSTAEASSSTARDEGGVGRIQSSSGAGANTTYINGGASDEPGSSLLIDTDSRPIYSHRFRLDAGLANCRFFCGFSPAETSDVSSASDNPANNYFGLQYSPVSRGDTTFQIAGKSSAGGTQVLVDTGIAPATGVIYRLVIDGASPTSWTATLYDDTPGAATKQLFTTTVTNVNAIPVTTQYTGNISMTETSAVVMTFTHYYLEVMLRAGAVASPEAA